VEDGVLQVLEAVLPGREVNYDESRALRDPRPDTLLAHALRVRRDPRMGDPHPGGPVQGLRIGSLDVIGMQRPAAEVDDDPDEGGMVPDPDLVRGQRGARCGGARPRRPRAGSNEMRVIRRTPAGNHLERGGSREFTKS
jgi:hypothetical protein